MEQWKLGRIFRAIVDTCVELDIGIIHAMWLAGHATSRLEEVAKE